VPTIVIRPQALADLAEIWAYIAEDSAIHADAFAARIDRKFHALARRPGIGRARPELDKDLRSFVVGQHVIFYLPISNGIEVIRVLHSARDIDVIRVLHSARDIDTAFEDEEHS
jgi:toxin ParE1/3/4